MPCRLRIVRTCSDEPMKRYNAHCVIDPKHFNEWGPSPAWLKAHLGKQLPALFP